MNLPMMPGQISSTTNALSVVKVAETTGTNILRAARIKASRLGTPSCSFRSAYSTTTIGSSTSTPTAMTRPNMIIMLSVMPMMPVTRNAIMNEIGIEAPIISAGRTPSVATQVISTSATAVSTEACSELNRLLADSDWSRRNECCITAGQVEVCSAVTFLTSSTLLFLLVLCFLFSLCVLV